jgi:prepilin peptidase CpaA
MVDRLHRPTDRTGREASMIEGAAASFGPVMLAGGALLLIEAGAHDIATRTVPNRVPAVLAALGAALQIESGHLPGALAAALGIAAVAVFCWRRGWIGGGDVKLLAAAALLVAPARVPGLILAVALAGGILAVLYVLLPLLLPQPPAARPSRLPARILRIELWRIRRRGPLPYASAIAAGAIFVLLSR